MHCIGRTLYIKAFVKAFRDDEIKALAKATSRPDTEHCMYQ